MIYPSTNLLQGFSPQLQNEDGSPRFLYHYTKFDNAINILTVGRLFMCSLEKQNDPWESLTRENTGVMGRGEPIEETCRNLRNHECAIAERKNYVRQASFSVDARCSHSIWRHGWNLTRMWAQYADNNAGVCLIFDYKQLHNDFDAAFANKTTPHFDRPINYVNLFELDELESRYWEATTTFLDNAHIDLLFTKHDDFEHEQEYRFLAANRCLKTSVDNLYLPVKKSFCGLITGKLFDRGYDKNRSPLREKRLRDAMDLCNKNSRLFIMLPNSFWAPLYDPVAEREHIKRTLGFDIID